VEPVVELETRLPRQADLQHQLVPDGVNVADADVALVHTGYDEVLPESAGPEPIGGTGELSLPGWIVRRAVL
jgi:hypothetical protein